MSKIRPVRWRDKAGAVCSALAMQYHVTGTNHATGARMAIDVEANSKIDAERKARNAGMDVQHAQPVDDGQLHLGSRRRGEAEAVTGMHPVLKTLLILLILGAAAWFGWGYFRG